MYEAEDLTPEWVREAVLTGVRIIDFFNFLLKNYLINNQFLSRLQF